MRKYGFFVALCWAAINAASALAQAETAPTRPEAPPNILENGDFETLNPMLAPSGWNSEWATSLQFIEDEDGNHYVRLKANGEDHQRRIFRRFGLQKAWKTLKVVADLGAENLQIGEKTWRDAHIVITFFDAKGKTLKYTRPVALLASSDWTRVVGYETVPPHSQTCEIEIANYAQSGDFNVDDVTIEPNGAVEAPLLTDEFPEGEFETLENGQPKGWPLAGAPGVSLQNENGNHFLRFANEIENGHVRLETLWRLKPNIKSLRVRARMRVRDLQKGKFFHQTARVGLGFTDAVGRDYETWPPALQLQGDSEWRVIGVMFSVPPTARYLKIIPELMQARGVLDVDDIHIEQLP